MNGAMRSLALVSTAVMLGCAPTPEARVTGFDGTGETAGESGLTGAVPTEGGTSTGGAVDSGDSSGESVTTGAGPIFDVGSDEPPPTDECAETAKESIYLLGLLEIGLPTELHRLNPDTLEVEDLGELDCGEDNIAYPVSLTVDRKGMIWALLMSGDFDEPEVFRRGLFMIDPVSLDCAATDYVDPIPDDPLYSIGAGLAFVADTPGGSEESLYLGLENPTAAPPQMALYRIDTTTFAVVAVGNSDPLPTDWYQIPDFVGTGNGDLFGLFAGDTSFLAEIEATDASVATSDSLEFGLGNPFSFTQWGGDFWVFDESGTGQLSSLRSYNPTTGASSILSEGIGVRVYGAGVSTCAPFTPEG